MPQEEEEMMKARGGRDWLNLPPAGSPEFLLIFQQSCCKPDISPSGQSQTNAHRRHFNWMSRCGCN